MGLSAHIVTSSVLSKDVPVITYCHDLFDSAVTEIWELTGLPGRSNLQRFYDNVRRNNYTSNIIPIIGRNVATTVFERKNFLFVHQPYSGESWKTLNIHDDNSVDMVFIDGDHTYEGLAVSLVCMEMFVCINQCISRM